MSPDIIPARSEACLLYTSRRYDCVLTAEGTDFEGRLSLSGDREGAVVFGFLSLMPKKTFQGHGLREDLALALKNTHARFLRFPGGCVVEGINEAHALRFSRTIGPVWERPSCQLMWHYRTTNGLGFHEYLQLCEMCIRDRINGLYYLTRRSDLYSIQNVLNSMMNNVQFLKENTLDASSAQITTQIHPSGVRMAIAVISVLPIMVI